MAQGHKKEKDEKGSGDKALERPAFFYDYHFLQRVVRREPKQDSSTTRTSTIPWAPTSRTARGQFSRRQRGWGRPPSF